MQENQELQINENQKPQLFYDFNFKIKQSLWNAFLILIVGCLVVAAIEGIGFREKEWVWTYPPDSDFPYLDYYNVNIINLTKLGVWNDYYNHLLDVTPPSGSDTTTKFLLLFHDTYAILVAGISILFISALVPLTTLLTKSNGSNKKIIVWGRAISFVGWLLVLIGTIIFFTKSMSLINEAGLNLPWDEQIWVSFSEVFETGSVAGLFILIILSGFIFLVPMSFKQH